MNTKLADILDLRLKNSSEEIRRYSDELVEFRRSTDRLVVAVAMVGGALVVAAFWALAVLISR